MIPSPPGFLQRSARSLNRLGGFLLQRVAWLRHLLRRQVRHVLPEKLDYLWRSCHGGLSEQNDLFHLTYAFELAKDAGWIYNLLTDGEWADRHAMKLNGGVYVLRSCVDAGFDSDVKLLARLKVRITGNIGCVRKLFESCGRKVCEISEKTHKNNYLLTAIRYFHRHKNM